MVEVRQVSQSFVIRHCSRWPSNKTLKRISKLFPNRSRLIAVDVCMYVYCTYYAPIYRANGMEKASFARIVGAETSGWSLRWFHLRLCG